MLFSEVPEKEVLKRTKNKRKKYERGFLQQLNAIEFDVHWFRRVFHTFSASFLGYYLLPDVPWINLVKIIVPLIIVFLLIGVEYARLRGVLDHQWFFGLRSYEKTRPASYLYFGVALVILLLFFPQQIAIPCILCAAFTDPIMGEARFYLGNKYSYVIGFLLSLSFFIGTWFEADGWVVILVSFIGATGALVGEVKKCRVVDDDFMIQMLPAVLLLVLWQALLRLEIDILPPLILQPL